MFGLDARHIEFIVNILKKNISDKNVRFYVFGSRAKGNYKEYSDIDIAVDFKGEKLCENVLDNIILEFENSVLPYEVDVIDLNAIDDNFKKLIKDSLVELKIL